MYETLIVERKGEIAVVTLNRPEALNAMNRRLCLDIVEAMDTLNRDKNIRALVITGAGEKAFCAGLDVKEARHGTAKEVEERFGLTRDVYQALRILDKPLVAAINGVAAGGGLQITLCADIRIGHPGTRMGQPEINAGLPSIMGSFFMTLFLGLSKNIELSMTGRLMGAEECRELGLLNRLVPSEHLMPEALGVARELGAKAPTALRLTKRRFREITQSGFDAAARAAVEAQQESYRTGEPQRIMEEFVAARAARK